MSDQGSGSGQRHQLVQTSVGYRCAACLWTFKSTKLQLACPGVPRYEWGKWPENLRSRNQLRRMKLVPGPVRGVCLMMSRIYKGDPWLWLYDVAEATPGGKRAAAARTT